MAELKTFRDYVTDAPVLRRRMTYEAVYEHLRKTLPVDQRMTVCGKHTSRYYFWIQRPDGGHSLTFTHHARPRT